MIETVRPISRLRPAASGGGRRRRGGEEASVVAKPLSTGTGPVGMIAGNMREVIAGNSETNGDIQLRLFAPERCLRVWLSRSARRSIISRSEMPTLPPLLYDLANSRLMRDSTG